MSTAWSAWVVSVWAGIVVLVQLVAVTRARAFFGPMRVCELPTDGTAHDGGSRPRVLLVRPCAGNEPHLGHTLMSTGWARWHFDARVRLSVADEHDAAGPVVRAAAVALGRAGLDASAVIARPSGPNHKTGQLAAAVDAALTEGENLDAVIVVDSDVDLTGLDLDGLVEPLLRPDARTGAAWLPPVEHDGETTGDRVSAAVLSGSMQSFPLLGRLDGSGLVGKTFAVRSDALSEIGGFSSLVNHLGEDMELARRLQERGWGLKMCDGVVRSRASGRSLRAVLERYVRWMLVIRAQRPHLLPSYPLLLAATPLVLALGLATVGAAPLIVSIAMSLVLASRVAVAWTAAEAADRPTSLRRALADAVLGDGLLLVAFLRACGPRRVTWRQRRLRIGVRGLLVQESAGDPIEGAARPCVEA